MQARAVRMDSRITLGEAAQALRLTYNRALNAVFLGELVGHRKDNGRWEVSEESVEAFRARRSHSPQPEGVA